MIDPDFVIEETDRAHLTATVGSEGFKVIQKIMAAECERFKVVLLNVNPAQHAEVLSAHNLAKAAAQFYAAVIQRINEEVLLYRQTPRTTDKPMDVTEGILDLDEIAASLQDVPSLLGGE